jgi:hypothetical protein
MSIGFIKLHRKIIEWEWYSDVNVCRVFLHLLLTANFENKKWQGIDISRGQVITSLEKLGKSTTLTIQQVRTALTKLKSTHEITIKATKLHTFITLTNYNLYQDRIVESNTPDNTPDNNSSTDDQQRINKGSTTTKEGKEIQEGKEVKKKPKGFVPPSLQEVQDYCKERNNSVSPSKFFDYYNAGNWKDAKGNAVKNWKQKLLSWEGRDSSTPKPEATQDSFCQSLNQILGQNLIKNLVDGEVLTIKLHSASFNDKWDRTSQELKDKVFAQIEAKFGKETKISF